MKRINFQTAMRFIVFSIFLFSTINCNKEIEELPVVDNAKIDAAYAKASQFANLKSLVISHNHAIIKEAYFNGGSATGRHDVRSVTKSVISLLVAIAIDKSFLKSTDQTLGEFLDPTIYTFSAEKSAIKIKHLLSMTSGFEWEELQSVSGYNNWITSENQVQYLLNKPLVNVPGEYFTYNSAALHLLSVILTKATGMPTKDFALKFLFEPLGIVEIDWQTDKQGFYNGGAGLKITPLDMIKIGDLVLNEGVYAEKTIISAHNINQIFVSKIGTNNTMLYGSNYGLGWWMDTNAKGRYFFANGYGGQFIVIFPDLKLVVVATNQWSGITGTVNSEQWTRTLNLILTEIVPAFN